MIKIKHQFTVPQGTKPEYGIGAYVRAVGEDRGTGQVIAVAEGQVLDGNKVIYQIIYTINWLDQRAKGPDGLPTGNDVISYHGEGDLAASARGVPKFADPADAERWLEQQLETGNWTAKAQDAADSSSDIDVGLRKLLDGE